MEDYYNDGYNDGCGWHYKNQGHDYPQTDGDRYSYERGCEYGEFRRRISDELDEDSDLRN